MTVFHLKIVLKHGLKSLALCILLVVIFQPGDVAASIDDKQFAEKLHAMLAAELKAKDPGGVVLVARNGRTIFRRAYGMADLNRGLPIDEESVFRIGSITKQFTAVAVLKLVEEGKLKLDDNVRAHVPDLANFGTRITIGQLLSHTSGLPNILDIDDFETFSQKERSIEEILSQTKHMPLLFKPGQGYRYSDTGYILLGAVVEKVSGLSFGEYLESKIFRPLGLASTYFRDDNGVIPKLARGYSKKDGKIIDAAYISMSVPHAAGSMLSTVDDLLRWNNALLDGKVISTRLLQEAWTPRVLRNGQNTAYGFGWKRCKIEGQPTVQHGGWINGFTATAIYLPDRRVNVIALVNNDEGDPDAGYLARRATRLYLTGSPVQKEYKLSAKQIRTLTGNYRLKSGEILTVEEKDGSLYRKIDNGNPKALSVLSPGEIAYGDSEGSFVLRFEFNKKGRPVKVRSFLSCEPSWEAVRM